MPATGSKRNGDAPQLPHPKQPIDPQHDPFVGNETVDDNICEWAKLAVWNAIPGHHLSVAVSDGVVTLAGAVEQLEQRRLAVAAAARVEGVRRVVDRIRVARLAGRRGGAAPHPAGSALTQVAARPMLYVVRHCVLDEASMSAALRQAVPVLDNALSTRGEAPMRDLIVIYRNRVPGAVTVEIGAPLETSPEAVVPGEAVLGVSPGGAMLSRIADAGLPGLLRREAELAATARSAGLEASPFFWQSFTYAQTHPWTGHPEASIYLPIVPPPASQPAAPGVPL